MVMRFHDAIDIQEDIYAGGHNYRILAIMCYATIIYSFSYGDIRMIV